jgi:hypothetical protein
MLLQKPQCEFSFHYTKELYHFNIICLTRSELCSKPINLESNEITLRRTRHAPQLHQAPSQENVWSEIDKLKREFVSLKATIRGLVEHDPIDLTGDDNEPTAKRPRIDSTAKSSLAMMHEHNQQLVQVKQEKTVIEASLRTVAEDLEDANELVKQQTLATDIWQRRYDELEALVLSGKADGASAAEIRNRSLAELR